MTSRPGSDRQTLVPYLLVERASDLIEYCTRAFDAQLCGRLTRPDGSLMHAELRIGDSLLMVGDPMGEFDPAPGWIFITVDDCDAVYARALEAGGTVEMEMTHMQHAGEKYGGVRDPFGNVWWIATNLEDVSWDEQQRRIDALAEPQP